MNALASVQTNWLEDPQVFELIPVLIVDRSPSTVAERHDQVADRREALFCRESRHNILLVRLRILGHTVYGALLIAVT